MGFNDISRGIGNGADRQSGDLPSASGGGGCPDDAEDRLYHREKRR